MKQNCQVLFDDRKRQLTVKYKINNLEQSMIISYDEIKKGVVRSLSSIPVQSLSYREFKCLASELSERFCVDPACEMTWSDQFCKLLSSAAAVIYPNGRISITPEQINQLKLEVKKIQDKLCKEAGITQKEFTSAVTSDYCSGVDTMFCTDDYLTIRQGDIIITRIALPGNDYSELRDYVLRNQDRILNPSNIETLRQSIREMKLYEALELANRKGTMIYKNEIIKGN